MWKMKCCYLIQVLQRRQGTASGGLTIRELNELLDRLASAENSCIFFLLVYSSILDCCIHIFSYYVMLMGGSLRNVEKKKMNLEVDVKSFD